MLRSFVWQKLRARHPRIVVCVPSLDLVCRTAHAPQWKSYTRVPRRASQNSKGVAELVKYLFLYLAMRAQARIAARNARHTLNLRHALALEDKKSKAG